MQAEQFRNQELLRIPWVDLLQVLDQTPVQDAQEPHVHEPPHRQQALTRI